jgi:hypothetical protein
MKEGEMRLFRMVMVVAVATALMPAMVWADNPNQESAQKIRDHITGSGQLVAGDKVAVRYLNGTVWLQGQVHDQGQADKVVSLVFETQGVTINQVIRDELACSATKAANPSSATKTASATRVGNPLRGTQEANRAQALPSSFSQNRSATPVAMMQPVPAPPTAAPGKLPSGEVTTGVPGAPLPMYAPGTAAGGPAPVRYDHPAMPAYAWPSYAAYPNYAAVTYPKQYSPTAWPYIGPFYPYPQVPLGWRKVSLEWDDGWWWLDFKDKPRCCWWR